MTTKPSAPWADTPFALLTTPGQPGAPTCADKRLLSVCVEMAAVHNVILRGLNAIYHQAPFVSRPTDVSDFMLYTTAWTSTMHHHHQLEEKVFFPRIETLAREAGVPCDMETNVTQHHGFEKGLGDLMRWVKAVQAGEQTYDGEEMRRLIDGFGKILTTHLHEEIDTLIGLGPIAEGVEQAMKDTATEGMKTLDPNTVTPLIVGCLDKGYPGTESFPPVPSFVMWLNAYWFMRKHQGSWRFSPSDHWGRPRPLQFLQ